MPDHLSPRPANAGNAWLASYPKSGNTWMRVLLTNYLRDSNEPAAINDLDTDGIASSRHWIDFTLGVKSSRLGVPRTQKLRSAVARRRHASVDELQLIKVHDAFRDGAGNVLFPADGGHGALYIVRDPRDVVTSYAHHMATTIERAVDAMNDPGHGLAMGAVVSQLRQFTGTWSDHVESWLDQDEIPVCIVRYEDLKSDPLATFARALTHLGLAVDEIRIRRAFEHSRIEKLQKQEDEAGFVEGNPLRSARFFRKGETGGWRHELHPSLVRRIELCHGQVMTRLGYLESTPGAAEFLQQTLRRCWPDFDIRSGEIKEPAEAEKGGVLWSSTAERAWLDVPGVARYEVSKSEFIIDAAPEANPLIVHDLAAESPVAMAALLRGEHVIDAAVVAGRTGAVALCGLSGTGKSSIAAALVATGWKIVTDGVARLTLGDAGPIVYPGAELSIAWPKAKPLIANADWVEEPLSLTRIVWLKPKREGEARTDHIVTGFRKFERIRRAEYLPPLGLRLSDDVSALAFWGAIASKVEFRDVEWIPGAKDLDRVVELIKSWD